MVRVVERVNLSRVASPMHQTQTSSVERLRMPVVFSKGEFQAWCDGIMTRLGRNDFYYVCELKVKGFAVVLRYEDGAFVRGTAINDDFAGQDVTESLKNLKCVPVRLSRRDVPRVIEIVGDLFSLQKETLLQHDTNPLAGPLGFFAHGIASVEDGTTPDNEWATRSFLRGLGFDVNPNSKLARTSEDAVNYYRELLVRQNTMEYVCEGVMVKISRFDYQQRLGYTEKQPQWAVNYTFPKASTASLATPLPKKAPAPNLNPVRPSADLKSLPLRGHQIAVRILNAPASQVEDMVRELGGTIVACESGDARFLVTDDISERVLSEAYRAGVKIVHLHDFLKYHRSVRVAARIKNLVARLG